MTYELINCPHCGVENDSFSATDDKAPKPYPGALGVCWSCRNVSIFTEDSQRKPTDDELADILKDDGVRKALAASRESYTVDEAIDLTKRALG